MNVGAVLLVLLLGLLTSCASGFSSVDPAVDLARYRRFFVVHRLTDDHHIDQMIVAELKARGREASAGPRTMMPDDTEVIVNYEDTWAWDFKSYLIQLNVELHDARKERPLGFGGYRQPSFITKSPQEVIHEIVSRMLK